MFRDRKEGVKWSFKSLGKCTGMFTCAKCSFEICKYKFKMRSVHTVEENFSSHRQLLRRRVGEWLDFTMIGGLPGSRSKGEEMRGGSGLSKALVIVLHSYPRNLRNLGCVKREVRTGVWRSVKKKMDLERKQVELIIESL